MADSDSRRLRKPTWMAGLDGRLGWPTLRADSDGRLGWPTRMADSDGRLGWLTRIPRQRSSAADRSRCRRYAACAAGGAREGPPGSDDRLGVGLYTSLYIRGEGGTALGLSAKLSRRLSRRWFNARFDSDNSDDRSWRWRRGPAEWADGWPAACRRHAPLWAAVLNNAHTSTAFPCPHTKCLPGPATPTRSIRIESFIPFASTCALSWCLPCFTGLAKLSDAPSAPPGRPSPSHRASLSRPSRRVWPQGRHFKFA
jgi:hypothetical protein